MVASRPEPGTGRAGGGVAGVAGEGRKHRDAAGSAAGGARRVDKPWGFELIWAHTDRYVGKVLVIRAGHRLSLQYHREKDESIYVMRGRMILHLADEDGTLRQHEMGPGDHRRVPVGRLHRFEAVEDVEVVEVSTPELDDVVRVEDDYRREGTSEP